MAFFVLFVIYVGTNSPLGRGENTYSAPQQHISVPVQSSTDDSSAPTGKIDGIWLLIGLIGMAVLLALEPVRAFFISPWIITPITIAVGGILLIVVLSVMQAIVQTPEIFGLPPILAAVGITAVFILAFAALRPKRK